MKAKNGCCSSLALALGRGLFALALVAFWQVGHAAKLPQWGTSGMTNNGNKSWSMSPGGGDMRVPIKNPGGGWQTAGNYGVQNPPTGTTYRLGANGEVFRSMPDGSTVKYPLAMEGGISLGDVVGAAAGFLSGPLALACAIGCPSLVDWMGDRLRSNPTTGQPEMSGDGFEYRPEYPEGSSTWYPSGSTACQAMQFPASTAFTYGAFAWNGSACEGKRTRKSDNTTETVTAGVYKRVYTGPKNWIPASMNDIAPYLTARPRPDVNVIPEILNKGGDVPLPKDVTVTGPGSINGPETTTNNPDGSRTVEKTTYNFTTNGNTVTNTTNNVTTTIYNTDNSVRSVSTKSTTPTDSTTTPEKEEKDPCEANPNRLGCSELDEPTGEIPKSTKNVTFAAESVWGGGACPSDKTWTSQTLGQSYVLIPWGEVCGWAGAMRAVVLALAAWAAFWIVMPGNTQVKPQ